MALSKANRILVLLAIDSIFFLVELISGYAVHSLALVADSFHMLNDVLSLCVGLWAVKVANTKASSPTYTYGWQRAETLGALVNGVFLVALCVTIFLEAIQRFVEPQHVTKPQLVLVVGCLGLLSNILGLVLFHDHGHSHGGGGHSHGGADHSHDVGAAEEGHAHSHAHNHGASHTHQHSGHTDSTAVANGQPLVHKTTSNSQTRQQRRHSRSNSRALSNSVENIPTNPYAIRNYVIGRSQMEQLDSEDEDVEDIAVAEDQPNDANGTSNQPLLNGKSGAKYGAIGKSKSIDHTEHNHAKPKEQGGAHGHSHADLNMRGIFLHVMGDALGNIGVIATALIIWLTDYSWRFYFDPAISLVITCIILASAIPLCKAASRILLQAVPEGIDVEDIQEDIEQLPGIISCHHLHVWQLSDTKKVASLHIQLGFEVKDKGSARYMRLAEEVNNCLHEYGIHSSTIQPEFCLEPDHNHKRLDNDGAQDDGPDGSAKRSKPTSVYERDCLLGCPDEGCGSHACCPPQQPKDGKDGKDGHGHGHAH